MAVQVFAAGAVGVALLFAQGLGAGLDRSHLFLGLTHLLRGIVALVHFFLHVCGKDKGFLLPGKQGIEQAFGLAAVGGAVHNQPQGIECP